VDVVVQVDAPEAQVDARVKADDRAAKVADLDDRVAKVADDLSDRKVAGNDRDAQVATMPESDSSD